MAEQVSMLRTIPFSELFMWDVKRFVKSSISSHYEIVTLGDYISERSEKVKLYEFPDDAFGILGVNNKEGVFDAYTEFGKNINQAYKKVKNLDLTYNPYRVNVGSIGMRTIEHKNEYISPAYVVFECKEGLNPEFLYKLFKTDLFNSIVNDNTTGSVRQNLKFETLAKIKIPLPSYLEQSRLVAIYDDKLKQAEKLEIQANLLDQSIEGYLYETLGIKKLSVIHNKRFRTVNFKDVDRWSVDSVGAISKVEEKFRGNYPLVKFRELILSYQYGLSEKASSEAIGIPMLRMNNIINSELDFSNMKYIKIDKNTFLKHKLNYGDLLFNRTNSKELVGKTALFERNDSFTFASYLIRVKVNPSKANNQFINFLFNSSILQFQKDLASRQITGQANINAQEMQEFLFPLPSLDKQQEIAEHIRNIKEQIKSLRTAVEQIKANAIKAFEQSVFNE